MQLPAYRQQDTGTLPGPPHLAAKYLYGIDSLRACMARVAVGGTFDPIHDGHIALLRRAFELGKDGEVVIGLTSDEMARSSRSRSVRSYESREEDLRTVIKKCFGIDDVHITKIEDQCGPSIYENFDFIVVSVKNSNSSISTSYFQGENSKLFLELKNPKACLAFESTK